MTTRTHRKRNERLQIMIDDAELEIIDNWRYDNRIPSRAAAIRELLRRGLESSEFGAPTPNASTVNYSVINAKSLGNGYHK